MSNPEQQRRIVLNAAMRLTAPVGLILHSQPQTRRTPEGGFRAGIMNQLASAARLSPGSLIDKVTHLGSALAAAIDILDYPDGMIRAEARTVFARGKIVFAAIPDEDAKTLLSYIFMANVFHGDAPTFVALNMDREQEMQLEAIRMHHILTGEDSLSSSKRLKRISMVNILERVLDSSLLSDPQSST